MDAEAAASLMTTAAAPGGLVVEDFTVKYGKFTAVDLVRLAVGPATVTALLGLNGAGKSSLLRGLMGLVPSQRAVTLSGTADDRASHIRSRRGLALISEGRGLFPSLSVEHNIVAGSIAVREGRRPRRRVRSLPHFVLLDEICRERAVSRSSWSSMTSPLLRMVDSLLVLDRGGLLAVGAPQEVVKLCRVREAYLGDLELSVGD